MRSSVTRTAVVLILSMLAGGAPHGEAPAGNSRGDAARPSGSAMADPRRDGSPSGSAARSELWEAVRSELLAMARADLAMTAGTVRQDNVSRLRDIIRESGWPTNSHVGREGARAAWLIAQHADSDVDFQRECLALIEAAHARGDVDGHDLAYLTDRIAVAEGRPQVYGTQGSVPYTPDEEKTIDVRRRALGLPTISEVKAMVARGEYPKIHAPLPEK